MTETVQRIVAIAESLSPEAQRALLDLAKTLAEPPSFYERMTPAQHAELEQSMAEANRGEVVDQAAVDKKLDALFARKR